MILDDHISSEIADILNEKGIRPGGSVRRDQADARFTDLRVTYLVHQYGPPPLVTTDCKNRGMLTKTEMASQARNHRMYVDQVGRAWPRHQTCPTMATPTYTNRRGQTRRSSTAADGIGSPTAQPQSGKP